MSLQSWVIVRKIRALVIRVKDALVTERVDIALKIHLLPDDHDNHERRPPRRPQVCKNGQRKHHECRCAKFYQCKSDKWLQFNCKKGLHFNARTKKCMKPKDAGCAQSVFTMTENNSNTDSLCDDTINLVADQVEKIVATFSHYISVSR